MTSHEQARQIYYDWHTYAKNGQIEPLLRIYTEDATFESPLVPILLNQESGVCRGREQLRNFFSIGVMKRPNDLVRWFRTSRYFFDGSTLIWEYPRETPDGDQIDILEVMELLEGKINRHRVYWGFYGVNQLLRSVTSTDKDR